MLETSGHFWEMVVQQKVSSIVMTTRCVERARTKCHQYWPTKKDGKIIYPKPAFGNSSSNDQDVISPLNNNHHQITVVYVDELFVQPGQFEIHKLKVLWKDKNTDKKKSFYVNHCHFKAWPDHGIPDTAEVMLNFVKKVRKYDLERRNSYWELGEEVCVDGNDIIAESSSTHSTENKTSNQTANSNNNTPDKNQTEETAQIRHKALKRTNSTQSSETQKSVKSLENYKIVVHCSAGIGRTGTFIVVDTCMHHFERSKRKEDTHFAVGPNLVFETSKDVRMQRALAIQTPDQYRFCYNAVGEYIGRNYVSSF